MRRRIAMICKFCGKEVGDNEHICKYCGTALTPPRKRPDSRLFPDPEPEPRERASEERYAEESDTGETRVYPRRSAPGGFESSRQVRDEVNRRVEHAPQPKRQYYRYDPEAEDKRARKAKKAAKQQYKQKKAKPIRKEKHIGRTIAGLLFKALLGFVIGFLLYILVINIAGWAGGALENLNIPFLSGLL